MAVCLSAITFRNLLQNQQSFVAPASPVTQHSIEFVSCPWNMSRQHFRTKWAPNFSVERLALLILIREVPSLNLGWETCCYEGFHGSRQGNDLTLDHDRFLSHPQFVIH